jgi:ariadne-2
MCMICYEKMGSKFFSLGCGHTFCQNCWFENLVEKVLGGVNCSTALCMQQGCNMQVGHSNFLEILKSNKAVTEKYWRALIKSFTDDNKMITWCSKKGCDWCF